MKIRLKKVNFGTSKTGLSTVGYTIYGETGSVLYSRSTSGVFEYGSTGVYAAKISLPERQEYTLMWDTGEATPRYAPDDDVAQLDFIQEETDRIRIIYNTLKNNEEAYSRLHEKINSIKTETNKQKLEEILSAISDIKIPKVPKFPTIDEIKSSLNVTVNPTTVNIPETKIPDYTGDLGRIRDLISNLTVYVNKIPKDLADRTNNLSTSITKIQNLSNAIYNASVDKKDILNVKSLSIDLLSRVNDIKKDIENSREFLNKSIVDNTSLDKTVKDLVKSNSINKIIEGEISKNAKSSLSFLGY